MKTLSPWDTVLAAPGPCDHLVQLYTSEDALASTVVRFIRHGLADGEGVVAIATAGHWAKITEGLTTAGINVAAAQGNSQLVVCDAHDTLARFMVDGMPDRAAMRTAVMSALDSTRGAGHSKVRAFGEMVDILNRRGNLAAAIRLEELWNELLDQMPVEDGDRLSRTTRRNLDTRLADAVLERAASHYRGV